MLASASPRNPYVPIEVRSSKAFSLEVVNLSQRIDKSSFLIPKSAYSGMEKLYMQPYVDAMAIVCYLE